MLENLDRTKLRPIPVEIKGFDTPNAHRTPDSTPVLPPPPSPPYTKEPVIWAVESLNLPGEITLGRTTEVSFLPCTTPILILILIVFDA